MGDMHVQLSPGAAMEPVPMQSFGLFRNLIESSLVILQVRLANYAILQDCVFNISSSIALAPRNYFECSKYDSLCDNIRS